GRRRGAAEWRKVGGVSRARRDVIELCRRVATVDIPVFVWGEPGVGKEIVARTVHSFGSRSGAPFIKMNCGAVQTDQLETMLFGLAGRAAVDEEAQAGLLERAAGGVLYLHN